VIVTVISSVVFDVPGQPRVEDIREKFLEAHRQFVGQRMQTVTGQAYVLVAIESLDVVRGRRQ